MNTVDVKMKIRCDMPNCKKFADIKIIKKGFLKSCGMYLCNDCAKELYEELAKRIVPKSPQNMLNKRKITKGVSNEK